MKSLGFFILTLSLLTSQAFGTSLWEAYLEQKREIVSHERHLPFQLTHGEKTKISVLLIHGIFSSPLYFRSMAQSFHDQGYNVVTILLPGHWEKDFRSMNKTTIESWTKEARVGLSLALELGDKVIVAGHSLGGLLGVQLALQKPDQIAGLVLTAPAVKVWDALVVACRAGDLTGIYGNQFFLKKPDGFHVPYFSPYGALLVDKLAKKVTALSGSITVPTFVAYTWADIEVDTPYLKRFFSRKARVLKKYGYRVTSGVTHGNIGQSPDDIPTYGNGTNQGFHRMMDQAFVFLRTHGL